MSGGGGRAKRQDNGQAISIEKYDVMWSAWQEKQSIAHAARAAGIARATARRYIDEGDASRGLEPLRDRLIKVRLDAARKADRDNAMDRAQLIRSADRLQAVVDRQIDRLEEDLTAGVKDPARALAELARVRSLLQDVGDNGGTDGIESVGRHALDGLTDEEVGSKLSALLARLGWVPDPGRRGRKTRRRRLPGPDRTP